MNKELLKELQSTMSLNRLAKTGLFQKLAVDDLDAEILREIKLHRAVLDKAIIDSFSQSEEIRQDVEQWLDIRNPDFREACERALLEPELVFRVFGLIKKVLVGEKAKFKKFGKRKTLPDGT